MNKMIVIVFNNEQDAYNGLSSLKDLHYDGFITLYSQSVIVKDNDGETIIKEAKDNGPIGTALGITLGGLVGLLGGPISALAGAYGGSFAGILYDINKVGVDVEFIDDVSKVLLPNTIAILANIEEEWMSPIDTKMTENNGIVFRKLRQDIEYLQMEKEMQETEEEIARLERELQESVDDTKENITKHLDAAKKKLSSLADQAKEKQEQLNKEFEEKVNTLREQITDVNEENKVKIQKTIDELTEKRDSSIDKLHRAYDAAKSELEK